MLTSLKVILGCRRLIVHVEKSEPGETSLFLEIISKAGDVEAEICGRETDVKISGQISGTASC